MAQDDEINEARRKAMRNGEEDPVVVAQRYLNIYRQMHIFSPERKAEFDKMLLGLPSEICNIFSNLPGGLMLQDYVNDLIVKNGGKTSAPDVETKAQPETPILETALSQAAQQQTQPAPSPVQYVQSGNMSVSLGQDFADMFSGAFDNVLKRQSELQAESLEKISANLSKNQLMLAQYINQSKEAQQQAFANVMKVFEEHQGHINQNITPQPQTASAGSSDNLLVLQQLIDGQKEINLRLNKMETTSLNSGNNNQELINALVKSNTEVMQKLASFPVTAVNASVPTVSDNTENLLKLIEQSQAQLIEGVVQRILQNNVTIGQNQANNNANNIQINTPDTSAQTLMLVNKISDLQAANEKNMEEVISRLIAAQKEIYTSIDNNRSQEIADAIIKGLQGSSLTFNNFVPPDYIAPQTYSPAPSPSIMPDNDSTVPQIEDYDNNIPSEINEEADSIVISNKPSKKKKKKKKDKDKDKITQHTKEVLVDNWTREAQNENVYNNTENTELNDLLDVPEPNENFSKWDYDAEPVQEENISEEVSVEEDGYAYPQENITSEPEVEIAPEPEPVVQEAAPVIRESVVQPEEKESDTFSQNAVIDIQDESEDDNTINGVNKFDYLSSSVDDWGFSSDDAANQDEELPSEPIADQQYEEVEIIGGDSYIYMDDLSKMENTSDNSPIIYDISKPKLRVVPQIYDDSDDDDPYVK